MAANDTIVAYSYVDVGFHLRALLWTSKTECRYVITDIKEIIALLDSLGFTYPRNQLDSLATKLEEIVRNTGEKTYPPEDLSRELRAVVNCVLDTTRSQANERRLLLLRGTAVSEKLRELAARGTLNTRQTYLFNETVQSLETGAVRSAVVMGWNLIYDIIRQWVFDDATRLAAFNTELATIVDRAGRPKFDPIANYTDFFEIGEKVVLDVCIGANLIGGNLYDDLRGHLRQRNNYAHASDYHPTVNQANGLIDHLVDAVARL